MTLFTAIVFLGDIRLNFIQISSYLQHKQTLKRRARPYWKTALLMQLTCCLPISLTLAQSKNFILQFDALFVELWRLIEGSRAVFARAAYSERLFCINL